MHHHGVHGWDAFAKFSQEKTERLLEGPLRELFRTQRATLRLAFVLSSVKPRTSSTRGYFHALDWGQLIGREMSQGHPD